MKNASRLFYYNEFGFRLQKFVDITFYLCVDIPMYVRDIEEMQLIGHHVKPKLTLLLLDFNKN
jgi:hypothetical protein